jgi:hypothetical protein
MRTPRFDAAHVAHLLNKQLNLRLDAGETAAFLRQLEEIDQRLFEVQYPELKAQRLIPVKGVNAAAQVYTYRAYDRFGKARRIANASDDSPRVTVKGNESSRTIASYGASYEYSVQDLRAAALLQQPLDFSLARAARDIQARRVEDLAAFGDSELGTTGFVNDAGVALVTPATGTWSTASPDQVLADLTKFERAVFANSLGIEQPNAMALAPDSYGIAMTARLPNTDISVLDYFLRKSLYVKQVEYWPQLALANAGGNGPRAVCYRRDPTKLELVLPFEFLQLPPEVKNYAFVVNTEMRTGGTVIRYPGSLAYMDGL